MPLLARETCLFPETLLESLDSQADCSQWMVIYTKPRQEKSLARISCEGRSPSICRW